MKKTIALKQNKKGRSVVVTTKTINGRQIKSSKVLSPLNTMLLNSKRLRDLLILPGDTSAVTAARVEKLHEIYTKRLQLAGITFRVGKSMSTDTDIEGYLTSFEMIHHSNRNPQRVLKSLFRRFEQDRFFNLGYLYLNCFSFRDKRAFRFDGKYFEEVDLRDHMRPTVTSNRYRNSP